MNEEELEHEFYARYREWEKALRVKFKEFTDRTLTIMEPVFFSFPPEVQSIETRTKTQ